MMMNVFDLATITEVEDYPNMVNTTLLGINLKMLAEGLIEQYVNARGMMPEACPDTIECVLDEIERLAPDFRPDNSEEFYSIRPLALFEDQPDFDKTPSIAVAVQVYALFVEAEFEETHLSDLAHALRDLGWIAMKDTEDTHEQPHSTGEA